ncbi:MAG: hypothetical protein AAF696_19035 [Bacteroidota bacterium]
MKPYESLAPLFEPQLLSFFAWWQLVVCSFAFLALMAIWWHIGRKQHDTGQIYLALSVLCWSITGGVELYYSQLLLDQIAPLYEMTASAYEGDVSLNKAELQLNYEEVLVFQATSTQYLDAWRSILSLLNSFFILLSLPWFRYLPKKLEAIIKSKLWIYIIGLPFLFSLLPTLSKLISGQRMGMISELDVYYSTLTLAFLGFVFWESFSKRRLIFLAWLSLGCILITFIAQLYKLTDAKLDLTLYSAIFKTSLTMIFFAMGLSWVKELSENVIPDSHYLSLYLRKQKSATAKTLFLVKLQGIPGLKDTEVSFSPTLYKLFLRFAERKKVGEGWLEIKPKSESRSEKVYDIQDHNEIKRLLIVLLDHLFGKGNWTKKLHEQPLRAALFEMSEKRERKIRLKIPAEQIRISEV